MGKLASQMAPRCAPPYRNLCAQIAADGYRGFTTTSELA